MSGVRAELVFDTPESCPVATASEKTDGPVTEISWTGGDEKTVTEQFSADDGLEAFESVFDYGARAIYEFDRERDGTCICEYIEATVGPVCETYARDGDLHVTLHAGDMTDLREHLQEFRRRFGGVRIEYLISGRRNDDDAEIIPVDVRRLTDRQREVLRTAYEMGYFEYPRGANASEVAEALDIRPSTFTEHLNAAQSKVLDELQLTE